MKINVKQKSNNGKQYYILVNGEKEYVDETTYRAYKRPIWAEHKRKEREKRCRIDGHRCTGDCSKCEKLRNGTPLSLESLLDESGYEPATSVSLDEIIEYRELLDKLFEELERLAPTDELILHLFSDGKSEREISRILRERSQNNPAIKPLSPKAVNLHKTSLFATLRERLKDYR